MPTLEVYIQQIADLSNEPDLDEGVGRNFDALDHTMLGDDALDHYKYDGPDDPIEKGKFLRAIRNMMEIRIDELEQLGHKPRKMTIVAIEKMLNDLDLLLEVDDLGAVRKLLAGSLKDLVVPSKTFLNIDDRCARIQTGEEEITKSIDERRLRGLEDLVTNFDSDRLVLKREFDSIGHPALRKHLMELHCAPGDRFAGSETYRTAKTAIENKVTTFLSFTWTGAVTLAEQSFGYFTESASGKKLPLSTAVKIDPGFQKALEKVDEKVKKGEDPTLEKEEAGKLAQEALKTLDKMPEKLKTATPSFFGKLQSTVFGLVSSLHDD